MLQKEFDNALISLTQGNIEGSRFLLAVSGGIDSMCMSNLFLNSKLNPSFGIAHVNFSLRGDDSFLDCELVNKWAQDNGVDFHTITFDTKSYAKQNSISTQMAARELRYGWFYKIMEEEGYDYLSIAHNLDDSIETLFINLLRGTGVKGLAGIRSVNGKIIRPILTISRKRITEYVLSENIQYRDDITNFESHYARNRIRNIIFPEFKKINPSFLNTVSRNTSIFNQASDILEDLFEQKRGILCREVGESLFINVSALSIEKHKRYWLFRILSEKGFNGSQIFQIDSCLDGQSGKIFRSVSHELVFGRGEIEVYPYPSGGEIDREFELPEPGIYTFNGVTFKFDIFIRPKGFKPITYDGQLYFDIEKVKLPLKCRGWRVADKFKPFGMGGGVKKLSDFFTDLKMDKRDKENQPILCDIDGIICLPGLRIDERYKITTSTKIIAEVVVEFS